LKTNSVKGVNKYKYYLPEIAANDKAKKRPSLTAKPFTNQQIQTINESLT